MSGGRRTPPWPALAAALAGLLWYLRVGAAPTLNPTHIAWALKGDWAQHVLGWLLFRNEPWRLPLGSIAGALYPVGSSVGFTDSNPLVSIALKPFVAYLPEDFQFIGLWLASCYVLQGYFGARLSRLITDDPWQQWLGGCLFVMAPVLLVQLPHDTLCAHWLILAVLAIDLRTYSHSREWRLGLSGALAAVLLASSLHPYLAVMVLVLSITGCVRAGLTGGISMTEAGLWSAGNVLAMLAVLAVLGYLGSVQSATVGFGQYSADLLTFINPMGYSRLLPSLPVRDGQIEGFAFLGCGGLLALLAAIIAARRFDRASWRIPSAVVLTSLLMGCYALSSIVTAGGHRVMTMRAAYAPFAPLTSTFRASGRFIWPIHYLLLAAGVWGCTRLFGTRRLAATLALACAVVIQVVDTKPLDGLFADAPFQPLPDWTAAAGRFRHLALVPMEAPNACPGGWRPDHVNPYMLQAYRLRVTFNSGLFARVDTPAVARECDRILDEVTAGALDADTIYAISRPDLVPRLTSNGAACRQVDHDWICVSDPRALRFLTPFDGGR